MKRMLLLFFVLIGFIALGSIAVESDDYRINDPPGIEYLGDINDQSQIFPEFMAFTSIQVFDRVRLPEIDDWPQLGELFINDPYALFNNSNKDLRGSEPQAQILTHNMTATIRDGTYATRKNQNWIKSYSMAH